MYSSSLEFYIANANKITFGIFEPQNSSNQLSKKIATSVGLQNAPSHTQADI